MALDGVSGRPPSIQQKAVKTLLRFFGIRPRSQNDLLPYTYRNQDPSVETRTARVEALKAVDGGKAELVVVEGEKLPVHGSPVARCGAFRDLQDGNAGGHLVQATPDDRVLHGEDSPAEPVMIPAAPQSIADFGFAIVD